MISPLIPSLRGAEGNEAISHKRRFVHRPGNHDHLPMIQHFRNVDHCLFFLLPVQPARDMHETA